MASDASEWAIGYTLEFADEGDALACVIGFGTQEATEGAVASFPLSSAPYTGPRDVIAAVLFACPVEALRP